METWLAWREAQALLALAEGNPAEAARQLAVLVDGSAAAGFSYRALQRRILLVAGEIMVATRHGQGLPSDPMPLQVETAEGSIRSLGTRFTVRQRSASTDVAVQE